MLVGGARAQGAGFEIGLICTPRGWGSGAQADAVAPKEPIPTEEFRRLHRRGITYWMEKSIYLIICSRIT